MTQQLPPTSTERVRLDKWLWAARFYKTRSLAVTAVTGGKVHLNGVRTKPGHDIKVGDTLSIRKDAYEFIIIIQGLSIRRGPAKVAALLYQETEESQQKREMVATALRTMAKPISSGRPSKKDRRTLARLRGQ